MTARARGPVRPDELEGYAIGVERRLNARRAAGTPLAEGEAALARGQAALRQRDWASADRELRAADALVDRATPETELVEWPRGLVSYEARGDRGVPPSREEEGLSNRLVLTQRLLAVRRAQGYDVEPLVADLGRAESAYAQGDRQRARELVDAVHRALDAMSG